MEPFRIPHTLRDIKGAHPEPASILDAATQGGSVSRVALARLWLSEGIPYAFSECPAVFEVLRGWLATCLDVHPKEISLTGSARIGKSISPGKEGRVFSRNSDLDLFVVSEGLFGKLRKEYTQWAYEFEGGLVDPSNPREESFWKDNAERGTKLISRGFIDHKLIPNRSRYPVTQGISQSMWLLTEKLKVTEGAPCPAKASIRSYRSWEHAIQQISLNLGSLCKR